MPTLASDSFARDPAVSIRPPWPACVATLVAFAALMVSAEGRLPLLPLLAIAMIGTYFFDARIEARWQVWVVRVILFGAALALGDTLPRPTSLLRGGLFDPRVIYNFGQLCAAELVIQCWRREPSGGARGQAMVLLGGMVFCAACTTFERAYIRWFTPPYILLTALALRDFRARSAGRVSAKKITLAAFALAIGLGAVSYVAIVENKDQISHWFMWMIRRDWRQHESVGLSEQPRLGKTFDLQGSSKRVLSIEGPLAEGHLAGMYFDTYQRSTWGPVLENPFESVPMTDLKPLSAGKRIRITRYSEQYRTLYAPLNCAGILPGLNDNIEWIRYFGAPFRVAEPVETPYSYQVILSEKLWHQGPLCTPPDNSYRWRMLNTKNIEQSEPRVRELSNKITEGIQDQLKKAQAIELYLRSNFKYSRTTDPGQGDPIVNFIMNKTPAHCEYFASAAVMLMRLQKIPSRYVIGYYAHEHIAENKLIVRQRDAHAWAQCYIDGLGWVDIDGTAAEDRPSEESVSLWERFSEWLADAWSVVKQWFMDGHWTHLLWPLSALLAAYFGVKLWRLYRSGDRPIGGTRFTYYSPNAQLSQLAQGFESVLQRMGAPCPVNVPWNEHLGALQAKVERPAQWEADLDRARTFASRYNDVRYRTPDDAKALAELQAMLATMEK